MAEYRLSAPAEVQIDEIVDWSQEKFGDLSTERYAAVLVAAMEDVAGNPEQKSVSWKRTAFGSIGVYHLSHSRRGVPYPPGPVGDPQSQFVYWLRVVEIGSEVLFFVGCFLAQRWSKRK